MRMITSSGSDFNPRSPRGGATLSLLLRWLAFGISIHAPHEGERHLVVYTLASPDAFQSTLPTRGSDHIFPRKKRCLAISIHAPHEGERPLAEVFGIYM